jgi:hypothetical protein
MGDYEGDGGIVVKLNIYPNVNVRNWHRQGNEWALCQFATKSLGQIRNDPDIILIPDITMGAALSSMPTAARNTVMDALSNRGFVVPSNTSATSMRDFLNSLANQLEYNIDVENGDVQDLE